MRARHRLLRRPDLPRPAHEQQRTGMRIHLLRAERHNHQANQRVKETRVFPRYVYAGECV